jgi:uncharacterized protein YjbJ (UPF0337 family)
MDKDRVKGSAEQAKGKVKEWTGKVTGDSKTESEGKADQAKGKVRNTPWAESKTPFTASKVSGVLSNERAPARGSRFFGRSQA